MNKQINDNVTDLQKNDNASFNMKSRIWLSLAFIAIAALSIWAVTSQIADFSFKSLFYFVKSSNPVWLITALLSAFGFIIFEAFALLYICNSFGFKNKLRHAFVYSASDIYFSAITPSATGGQPASAYFMIKSGISGAMTTAILIANLMMYTLVLVFLGFVVIILSPSTLISFSTPSIVLIVIGFVVQAALLFFFVMLFMKPALLHKLCIATIKLLAKIKLIRKVEQKLEKLERWIGDYTEDTNKLKGKHKMFLIVFIFNLLQRLAQILVTPLTALATGCSFSEAYELFISQIYVFLGSNCVPIPGAMGVTDALMIDSFKNNGIANPEFLELFSRSLSFYLCVIVCGITVVLSLYSLSKRRKKDDRCL